MKSSVVFITQIPSRLEKGEWVPTVDVNPAKEHGELSVMFPAGMNHASIGKEQHGPLEKLMRSFNPERDFLLPMGDPLLMCAAAAALGAEFVDTMDSGFSILRWDRHARKYVAVRIELP